MERNVLGMEHETEIRTIVREAFAVSPWNDNRENEKTLHLYIQDIIRNANALGLYNDHKLVGLSLGR